MLKLHLCEWSLLVQFSRGSDHKLFSVVFLSAVSLSSEQWHSEQQAGSENWKAFLLVYNITSFKKKCSTCPIQSNYWVCLLPWQHHFCFWGQILSQEWLLKAEAARAFELYSCFASCTHLLRQGLWSSLIQIVSLNTQIKIRKSKNLHILN